MNVGTYFTSHVQPCRSATTTTGASSPSADNFFGQVPMIVWFIVGGLFLKALFCGISFALLRYRQQKKEEKAQAGQYLKMKRLNGTDSRNSSSDDETVYGASDRIGGRMSDLEAEPPIFFVSNPSYVEPSPLVDQQQPSVSSIIAEIDSDKTEKSPPKLVKVEVRDSPTFYLAICKDKEE